MVAATSLDHQSLERLIQIPSNLIPSSQNGIAKAHFQEWEASAVDPGIIAQNVESLSGDEVYRYIIPDPAAVTKRVQPDAQWRTIRQRYGHLELGGWWASGCDPLNGYGPMEWGCLKPNAPRLTGGFDTKKIKTVKYEHPFKTPLRATFLNVPLHIWEKISERYGVELPPLKASTKSDVYIYSDSVDGYTPSISFWQWVHENNLPITIVEGVKKAGAVLSAGYIALALPGIFAGYRATRDDLGRVKRALIPDLQHFATAGREINICFDYENRPVQLKNLNKAICGLSFLLTDAGCSVRLTDLPGKEKGVDDFIFARGVDAYDEIHAGLTPNQWTVLGLSRLTSVSVTINQRFLGDMECPDGANLIAIKSPKGTGKTEWLIKIARIRQQLGLSTLVLSHRIQLAETICSRLGLDYVTEVRDETGKLLGFGLCVDSMHLGSKARFNASDWKDVLVIVDECEQVFWHTLNASTEVKKHRPEVISQLATLFKNALTHKNGGVILLDADLSDLSIEFVLGLAEVENVKPWVVLNEWKPEQGRLVIPYEKPSQMLAALEEEVESGEKVMIITQAQRAKSKYGTINLEAHLRSRFPGKRILRADSDTIRQPGHPAFGCIAKLNEVLPLYDIVIFSPSLETGVSIDIKGHFASVWAFCQGVSAVNTACQSVARLRELVPLHVYAEKRGLSFVGNQSTNHTSLISGQNQVFKTSLSLIGFDGKDNYTLNSTAIKIWGKMAARVNGGMREYRDSILAALKAEGHTVIETPDDSMPVFLRSPRIDSQLKAIKEDNYIAECIAISDSDVSNMTHTEYEKLKAKKAKTPEEHYVERKYELVQRYSVDVTPDLVAADDDGLYPAIRLQYYLCIGRQYLLERDKKVMEKMLSDGMGKVFVPDFNKSILSATVATMDVLGLPTFMAETNRQFRCNDSDMQVMLSKAIQFRREIKDLLGVTIGDKDTPIEVLRRLLKKVAIKLQLDGRDGTLERQRFYTIKTPNDWREEIFSKWLSKDEANNRT
jgi:hypothetical protein